MSATLFLGWPLNLFRWEGSGRILGFPFRALCRIGQRLNRKERNNATRSGRGLLLLTVAILLAGISGAGVHWVAMTSRSGVLMEIFFLAATFPCWFSLRQSQSLRRALQRRDLKLARRLLGALGPYDPTRMDPHSMARVTVEFLVTDFAARCVATSFYYVLFGLPGAWIWCVTYGLHHYFLSADPRLVRFGDWPRRLSELLAFVPFRLTLPLIGLALPFIPKSSLVSAFRQYRKDIPSYKDYSSLPIISLVAGALHVALGGPISLTGGVLPRPWVGQGSAKLLPGDILKVQMLYAVAFALLLLLVAATNV